jgi:hypothetical protein
MEQCELASSVTKTIDRAFTKMNSHLKRLVFIFLVICTFREGYFTEIFN